MCWITFGIEAISIRSSLLWFYLLVFFQVHKVIFEGKRATEILFEHYGEMKKVKAKKEIILSAGKPLFTNGVIF